MNKKNLYLLIAIAVVLAGIIIQNLIKPAGPAKLAEWNSEKVDKIVINNNSAEIVFEKQEDGIWLYGPKKFPTDDQLMNGLINRLDNSKILQKVTDKEDYGRYGLSDGDAGIITVYQSGKEVARYIVGQEDASSRFSYIRLAGKKGVYLVSRNLREQVEYDLPYYREMDVLRLEAGTIERIKVSGNENYELVRMAEPPSSAVGTSLTKNEVPGAVWKLKGDESVRLNQQAVKVLVNSLEIVQVTDYIDAINTEEIRRIELFLKDGSSAEIKIFAPDQDGKFPVISSGSKYKALLQSYESKSIMKNLVELLEK